MNINLPEGEFCYYQERAVYYEEKSVTKRNKTGFLSWTDFAVKGFAWGLFPGRQLWS